VAEGEKPGSNFLWRGQNCESQGRPLKSLSSIARTITGTRWNGWVFVGLRLALETSPALEEIASSVSVPVTRS
jgi:hypothetical protein